MILIKEEIRRRIAIRTKRRAELLEDLTNLTCFSAKTLEEKFRQVVELNLIIRELQGLLECKAEATPIHPDKTISEMSPIASEAFHWQLFKRIDLACFSAYCCNNGDQEREYRNAAFKKFKLVNTHFVNIASLQWVRGFKAFLEEMERLYSSGATWEAIIEGFTKAVDQKLHEVHQAETTFEDNLAIIEKELNIS